MTGHQITDPEQALKFILAGNSTVTLRSLKTGAHLTFKVKKPKGDKFSPDLRFVSVLDHADGKGGYTYLGMVKDQNFSVTKKSVYYQTTTAPAPAAIRWLFDHVKRGEIPQQCEIWHEGRCGRCGRKLTDPTSISTGLGPECIHKIEG